MNHQPSSVTRERSDSLHDSGYAWLRLAASLIIGSTGGVGLWSSVVLLPETQAHFELDRASASLPYTFAMVGIMAGNIGMGRLIDRFGIAIPVLISSISLFIGYVGIAYTTDFGMFLFFQGILIGALGTSVSFGPMIAAISLWFIKYRGIAVALVACGSYLAGTVWPPLVQSWIEVIGWRDTHLLIGAICLVVMLPTVLIFLRPAPIEPETSSNGTGPVTKIPPLSPNMLQILLILAGVFCCVAMSMPQVHIVAYCVDLNLGAKRGAEMLAVMLGAGLASRIIFGFVTDWIGATWTILIGSALQALTLLLYLKADGLFSLYVVSALFGLFQGGIVPAYAVLIRDYYPASQAGIRVGLVLSATIGGMAIGGWLSGAIFDWTLSYEAAFINGFLWNLIHLMIISLLLWKGRRPDIFNAKTQAASPEIPIIHRWPGVS